MKITVTEKKEIEIDDQGVRRNYSGFVQQLIEKENTVLSEEYLNWLAEFVKREECFDDEANRVDIARCILKKKKKKYILYLFFFLSYPIIMTKMVLSTM